MAQAAFSDVALTESSFDEKIICLLFSVSCILSGTLGFPILPPYFSV